MQQIPNEAAPAWKGASFALTNLFIIVYSLGTFIMCSPPSVCHDALVAIVKPLFNFFGVYQMFWMYAPDPPKVYTVHVCADIAFADGSHKVWEMPRLQDYKDDFYKHQSKHRYYQWKYYFFDPTTNPQILPDAAIYAARMNLTPGNPPVSVLLYTETDLTVVPAFSGQKHRTRYGGHKDLFFYKLKPGDL